MGVVAVFLLVMTLIVGNLYFQLHALPEHKAHRMNRGQFEIVAILSLLALFTHNHLFWVAALLLAMVNIPDFSTPLAAIADSVGTIAGKGKRRGTRNPRKGQGGLAPSAT